MKKFEKFIKALELIKPEGKVDLGLVINESGKKINWKQTIDKKHENVKIKNESDDLEKIKTMHDILNSKKWLILETDCDLSSLIYNQLQMLSKNNHMQYMQGNEIIDFSQPEETRMIICISADDLRILEEKYSGFINIFGPVIRL